MIYLDYAATTPLDAEARIAMQEAMDTWGNPSSVHAVGRAARRVLEEVREHLACVVGARSAEVVFTSGGSEADTLALVGASLVTTRRELLISALEHSAVLNAARWLGRLGYFVRYLQPDKDGLITAEQVGESVSENTALVSIMALNNELGTIYPVPALAEVAHRAGALFHTDAVQAFGSIPFDFRESGADLASISAHKFYGPRGAGALLIRRGVKLAPPGAGSQERGLRGGTENLPAIVGMGVAAEKTGRLLSQETARLVPLRERLERALLLVEGVELNAKNAPRGPKHVNVTVQHADGEALLLNLDLLGVAASSGSACSAGSLEPSHVLLAMGRSRAAAKASIRFSLGRGTDASQIDQAAEAFALAVRRARAS